jgi:hypothetical protein
MATEQPKKIKKYHVSSISNAIKRVERNLYRGFKSVGKQPKIIMLKN